MGYSVCDAIIAMLRVRLSFLCSHSHGHEELGLPLSQLKV